MSFFSNLCGKCLRQTVVKLGHADVDGFLSYMGKLNHVVVERQYGGENLYRAGVSCTL